MKAVSVLALGTSLLLVACSGSGSKAIYHPDVGPFDENGDYVAALADAPVKKNFFSRRSKPKSKPKAAPKPAKQKSKAVEAPTPVRVARVTPRTEVPRPTAPFVRSTPARPSQPVVIAQSPRRTPVVAAKPRPKPKPKAVAVKPKKKAPVRHTVRKSDTLYGLSRKYGTSVSAIQRANGLRGNTIVTGKTILIPR